MSRFTHRVFLPALLFAAHPSLAQQLPDLAVDQVSPATQDPQSLQILPESSITAWLSASAMSSVQSGLGLAAFFDANANSVFEPGVDLPLGEIFTPWPAAGGELWAQIPVVGELPYRDAPITVLAATGVAEAETLNNLASSADACRFDLFESGSIEPALKWYWQGDSSPVAPGYTQVMSTPMVGPLQDTNGDGRFDQKDVPAVAFVAFQGGFYASDGVLRVVDGESGRELWSAVGLNLAPGSNPAIADLDGDGAPEVIAVRAGGGLIAFGHDGSVRWSSPYGFASVGGPAIANLIDDPQGLPEVLLNNYIYSGADGSLLQVCDSYSGGHLSVVADVNLDGRPEVIGGASVCDPKTGLNLWRGAYNGYAAIGNLFGDEYPEIVVSAYLQDTLLVYQHVFDAAGGDTWQLAWQAMVPSGGGGPPTLADMDNDGQPEIGVAGSERYVVFNADGSVLWQQVTEDTSSRITGSSVFDFNADGKAEVIYADHHFLRVYNGEDGRVIYEVPNSSGTLTEMPVLVDVDGDEHAEIVVASNNYIYPGTAGVRVFEDVNDAWASTRRIWNQHSYHINNIHDDASVPTFEQASWLSHNTYRLNTYPDRQPQLGTGLADLTVGYLRRPQQGGLIARIGNAGLVPAEFEVVLRAADGSLLDARPSEWLAANGHTDILLGTGNLTEQDLLVEVDPANRIQECNEENNELMLAAEAIRRPDPEPDGCGVFAVQNDNERHSQLIRVDLDTGQVEPLGELWPDLNLEGLALDPVSASAYAVSADQPSHLFRVDVATGALDPVGAVRDADGETFDSVTALAFRADGSLWGYANKGKRGRRGIIQIDPETGLATLREVSMREVESLAWTGDRLWLLSNKQLHVWSGDGITSVSQLDGLPGNVEGVDGLADGRLLLAIHHGGHAGLVVYDPVSDQLGRAFQTEGYDNLEAVAVSGQCAL